MILLRFYGQRIKIMKGNNVVLKEKKPAGFTKSDGFLKKNGLQVIRILNILKCLFWLPDRLLPKQSLKSKLTKKPVQQ